MFWLPYSMANLPAHCEPNNDFLLHISAAFHTCQPTSLALASNVLGYLSATAWVFAQLPQLYKNWRVSSTSGLSFSFLVAWFLGDTCNFLGSLFTHQAFWQIAIGVYYVFLDICLCSQWFWYEKLGHGNGLGKMQQDGAGDRDDRSGRRMQATATAGIDGTSLCIQPLPEYEATENRQSTSGSVGPTQPSLISHSPIRVVKQTTPTHGSSTAHGRTISRTTASSSTPPSNPRTILLLACLAAMTQAQQSTEPSKPRPTALEHAGFILAWVSTILYLGSRLPQILQNWRRKSTAGLSPGMFAAAFFGNVFYSAALLTNPKA